MNFKNSKRILLAKRLFLSQNRTGYLLQFLRLKHGQEKFVNNYMNSFKKIETETPRMPKLQDVQDQLLRMAGADDFTNQHVDNLSDNVLNSMIVAAMEKKDYETLEFILKETLVSKDLLGKALRKTFTELLNQRKFEDVSILVEVVYGLNLLIPESVCQEVFHKLIIHFRGMEAVQLFNYMIERNHNFFEEDVHFLISFLMKSSHGFEQVLKLMSIVTDYRRDDLEHMFDFQKAFRTAISVGEWNSDPIEIRKKAIEETVNTIEKAIDEHGWFSHKISTMLVSLACITFNFTSVTEFIRFTVDAVSSGRVQSRTAHFLEAYESAFVLLRGFLGAALLATERRYHPFRPQMRDKSTVARKRYNFQLLNHTILDLSLCCGNQANLRDHPKVAESFLRHVWILNYHIKSSALYVGENMELQQMYDSLHDFVTNPKEYSTIFRVRTGLDRRNFLGLCDEMAVTYIVDNSSMVNNFEYGEICEIEVSKPRIHEGLPAPPTLYDIVRRDSNFDNGKFNNLRRFDGPPLYWKEMSRILETIPPEEFRTIIGNVFVTLNEYPSVEMALILVELLMQKNPNCPLPLKLKSGLISMCYARHDIHGLLEVIDIISREAKYFDSKNIRKKRSDQITPLRQPEPLTSKDWNNILLAALNCRFNSRQRPEAYSHSFSDVVMFVSLDRIRLDSNRMESLLKYLIAYQPLSLATYKLLSHIYYDRNYAVNHIHCVAVSRILLGKLRRMAEEDNDSIFQSIINGDLKTALPLFSTQQYLKIQPVIIRKATDGILRLTDVFGESFVKSFESVIDTIYTPSGAMSMFNLLSDIMDPNSATSRRTEIIADDRHSVRGCLVIIGMHTAYLLGINDYEQQSRSFALLFEINRLLHDHISFVHEQEKQGRKLDRYGNR